MASLIAEAYVSLRAGMQNLAADLAGARGVVFGAIGSLASGISSSVALGAALSRRVASGMMSVGSAIAAAYSRGKEAVASFVSASIGAGKAVAMASGVAVAVGAKQIAMWGQKEDSIARLSAVLKATGGAAGLSTDDLVRYATELQRTTRYSDELTINSIAMMATFKNLNGTEFKRAIALAQDLSSVFNNDLKGSTVQLGKALEDPREGLDALMRVGVRFSKEQKHLIENFIRQGKIVEAQNVILDQLTQQVGGASQAMAKTSQGTFQQFMNVLNNIGEQIGRALVPAMEAIIPIVTEIASAFERLIKTIPRDMVAVSGVVGVLTAAIGGVLTVLPLVAPAFTGIAAAVKGLTAVMFSWSALLAPIAAVVGGIKAAFAALFSWTAPIVVANLAIVASVIALGAAFATVFREASARGESVRAGMMQLYEAGRFVSAPLKQWGDVIRSHVTPIWERFKQTAADWFLAVVGWVEENKGTFRDWSAQVHQIIVSTINAMTSAWEAMSKAFVSALDWLRSSVSISWEDIRDFITEVIEQINMSMADIPLTAALVWTQVKLWSSEAWDWVVGTTRKGIAEVVGVWGYLKGAWAALMDEINSRTGGFVQKFIANFYIALEQFKKICDAIVKIFKNTMGAATAVAAAPAAAAATALNWLRQQGKSKEEQKTLQQEGDAALKELKEQLAQVDDNVNQSVKRIHLDGMKAYQQARDDMLRDLGGAGESEATRALREERDRLIAAREELRGQLRAGREGMGNEPPPGPAPGAPSGGGTNEPMPYKTPEIKYSFTGFAEMAKKIQESITGTSMIGLQRQVVEQSKGTNARMDIVVANTKMTADNIAKLQPGFKP